MVASIEFIEQIIETYVKAADANRTTPGRRCTVVELDAELADEVMITGDLHGNRRNFNLIRRLANLEKHPRRHLILQEVCHGGPTYPQNGGCMSHYLLEQVAKLKVQFPGQVHFLMSNHELAEMTEYPIQKNRQMLNLLFRLGLQQMYGIATDKVRESFLPFIQTCPLAVRLPSGIFISHSIPENAAAGGFDKSIFSREPDSLEFHKQSSIFKLLWGRNYTPENAQAFAEMVDAKILINGHEPCPEEGYAVMNKHQIILDCCSVKATFALIPVREGLSLKNVLSRIRRLPTS